MDHLHSSPRSRRRPERPPVRVPRPLPTSAGPSGTTMGALPQAPPPLALLAPAGIASSAAFVGPRPPSPRPGFCRKVLAHRPRRAGINISSPLPPPSSPPRSGSSSPRSPESGPSAPVAASGWIDDPSSPPTSPLASHSSASADDSDWLGGPAPVMPHPSPSMAPASTSLAPSEQFSSGVLGPYGEAQSSPGSGSTIPFVWATTSELSTDSDVPAPAPAFRFGGSPRGLSDFSGFRAHLPSRLAAHRYRRRTRSHSGSGEGSSARPGTPTPIIIISSPSVSPPASPQAATASPATFRPPPHIIIISPSPSPPVTPSSSTATTACALNTIPSPPSSPATPRPASPTSSSSTSPPRAGLPSSPPPSTAGPSHSHDGVRQFRRCPPTGRDSI